MEEVEVIEPDVVVSEEEVMDDKSKIKCNDCGHEAPIANWSVIEIDKDDGLTYVYTVCPLCGLHYLGSVLDDKLKKDIQKAKRLNKVFLEGIEADVPQSVLTKMYKELDKVRKYNEKRAAKLKEGKELTYRSSEKKAENNTVKSDGRSNVDE